MEPGTMGTTTQNAKYSVMTTPRISLLRNGIVLALASTASQIAVANQLDVKADVSADAIFQQVSSETAGRGDLTTLTLDPSVTGLYTSRTFSGTWSGKLTHLERSNNDDSVTNDYATYQYTTQWRPIDRFLTLSASGVLNYQNTNTANFLISDYFTNSEELSKTRSNRLAASVSMMQGDWVRGQGQLSYSDVQSEQSRFNNFALNNDTYGAQGSLQNGDEARLFIWNVQGSYQVTKRSQADQGDFISRNGTASVDTMLLENVGIRLTASHEANQISDRNDTSSRTRQYNSAGIGLTYRQSSNRYISLTANQYDSENEDDSGNTFIGVDMAWSFSERTSVAMQYGRRFYGESGSASFNYNTKHFRSKFSYSEDITNTSRLLATPENLGVFVCPTGSTAIADCFQPNSLTYTPQEGEQLVQLATQNLELNDNVILQKSGALNLGYDFSRVKLGMDWGYSRNEYLDLDRLTVTYSAGVNLSYKLGSYTNLTSKLRYANIEQRSATLDSGTSDNWTSSVAIERELGKHLRTNFTFSYLDKSGDLANNGQYGANYQDRRVSVGITYKYE